MSGDWSHKNLKTKIALKVKERLKEHEQQLDIRRQRLAQLLEMENEQYQAELVLLRKCQIEDMERARLDGIRMHVLERKMAEEEFLRLKQVQRQIENSQEERELESKNILLETKMAQIYQMEEKKALRRKQQEEQKLWLQNSREELEKKNQIAADEENLRKVIAKYEQEQNLKQAEVLSKLQRSQANRIEQETANENKWIADIDKKLRDNEKHKVCSKKVKQREWLTEQIRNKCISQQLREMSVKQEDITQRDLIENDIAKRRDFATTQKLQNREWHKQYLAQEMVQKQLRIDREKAVDQVFAGKACVLEQKNKKPYNKNTR